MGRSNYLIDRSVTTIDIFPQVLCLGELQNRQIPLLLPHNPAREIEGNFSNNYPAIFADVIAANKQSINGKLVVFGYKQDPFNSPKNNLSLTLNILEAIIAQQPEKLLIQTRSPLILLAVPLLKAVSDFVGVTIALETDSDEDNSILGLGLPRPSERLKAARILKNLNIPIKIQYTPFYTNTQCYDPRVTTHILNRCSHKLRLLPLSCIRPLGTSCNLFEKIDWKLCEKAFYQVRALISEEGRSALKDDYQKQAAA